MRAHILSIGRELILGHITDTNATFLSQELVVLGIELFLGQRFLSLHDSPNVALVRFDFRVAAHRFRRQACGRGIAKRAAAAV